MGHRIRSRRLNADQGRCRRIRAVRAGAWLPGIPDVPDADSDGVLDALAGHANFVAGLIAQGCPQAEITIRNHNGGFGRPCGRLDLRPRPP